MKIYVDVKSKKLPLPELRRVLAAVNKQIQRDFLPEWALEARLVLRRKGKRLKIPPDGRVGLLHLLDHGQAAGYHIEEESGIPAGFVMFDLPEMTKSSDQWLTWTVAFSHEVLELIADPFLNLLVKGPHPKARREVFHYREICDPVQGLVYEVDGVKVSNFVLPHYYNGAGQKGHRNDFLDSGLKAFRWIDQGYIGFWDPKARTSGKYVVFPEYDPKKSAHRARRLKGKLSRLVRYSRPHLHDDRR